MLKMSKIMPRITIYDRYIFSQVLFTTFVAILLFTVVWIAPEMLLKTIEKTISGVYTPEMAVKVLICEIPKILGKAFPVGLLLGSLFTFDKLSKDFELTIFRAVGLSFKRIVAPVLVFSLIITVLCFITYDKFIPLSENILGRINKKQTTTQYIYTEKNEKNIPQDYVIVSKYENGNMTDVLYLTFGERRYADIQELNSIYHAKTGIPGDDKWILNDIDLYEITSDGVFKETQYIKSMEILNGESASDAHKLMIYATKRDREFTNSELKNYVNLLKKEGLDEDERFMLNKYYQRFSHPFVCVALALLGVILGFSKPREQRVIGFTIAIGCVFGYYITLPFFDLLAEKGVLPPILTATLPLIAFIIAICFFYKSKEI